MTSRASVGFFAVMDSEVCTNQEFINIIPHDEETRMYLLFNLTNRVTEIRSNAKGTTYPEISKGRFRAMDIVIPPESLISEFGKLVGDMIQQMRCLKRTTLQLTQARDLLLPRLINGELATCKAEDTMKSKNDILEEFALFSTPAIGGIGSWLTERTHCDVFMHLGNIDQEPLSAVRLNQLLVLGNEAPTGDDFFRYYWLEASDKHPYDVRSLPGFSEEFLTSEGVAQSQKYLLSRMRMQPCLTMPSILGRQDIHSGRPCRRNCGVNQMEEAHDLNRSAWSGALRGHPRFLCAIGGSCQYNSRRQLSRGSESTPWSPRRVGNAATTSSRSHYRMTSGA